MSFPCGHHIHLKSFYLGITSKYRKIAEIKMLQRISLHHTHPLNFYPIFFTICAVHHLHTHAFRLNDLSTLPLSTSVCFLRHGLPSVRFISKRNVNARFDLACPSTICISASSVNLTAFFIAHPAPVVDSV